MANKGRCRGYRNLQREQQIHALRYEQLLLRSGDYCIRFQPILAKICGDVSAGLMLSQAIYWSSRTGADGWFYKTSDQWTAETCLTRHQQVTARRILRNRRLWDEKRRGAPPITHYRVNFQTVCEKVAAIVSNATNSPVRHPEIIPFEQTDCGELKRTKPAVQVPEIRTFKQPKNGDSYKETETTAKTTAENTAEILLPFSVTFEDLAKSQESVVDISKEPPAQPRRTLTAHQVAIDIASQMGLAGRNIRLLIEEQINNELRNLPGITAEQVGKAMIAAFSSYRQSGEGRSKYRKSPTTFFSTPTWKENPKLWERANAEHQEQQQKLISTVEEAKRIVRGLGNRAMDDIGCSFR